MEGDPGKRLTAHLHQPGADQLREAGDDGSRIFEIRPIRWLLDQGVIVICAGGGRCSDDVRPCKSSDADRCRGRHRQGSRESASRREVGADLLVMATDVDGVYADWSRAKQRRLGQVTSAELRPMPFAAGSMGPKAEAAALFVEGTRKRAAIGALAEILAFVEGRAGTKWCPAERWSQVHTNGLRDGGCRFSGCPRHTSEAAA